MNPFSFFVLFIFGLAFGSFLNVLAFRYRAGGRVFVLKRLLGRSRCPQCGKTLSWHELLPVVSFLFLRGRCGTCKKRISWQYPIVEMISGFLFVLVPMLGISDTPGVSDILVLAFTAFWIIVFFLLLLMSVIDIRHYLIPDELNVGFLVLGFFGIFLKMFLSPFRQFFIGSYSLLFTSPNNEFIANLRINEFTDVLLFLSLYHILGALIAGGFFWAVHALTKGRGMGFGDVKLGFALGFLLGWPDILFALMFAFLIGGAWSLFVLVFRRYGMKSKLPFGPFFALGVLWLFMFGEETLMWYFGWFGV